MEFYIHSDRCFLREEENGAFKLMALATNQTLDFDGRLHAILGMTDRWADAEHIARVLQLTTAGANMKAMLWNALFSLHACGLADLRNVPVFAGDGLRWANVWDYYALSCFCTENLGKGQSCAVYLNPRYYGYFALHSSLSKRIESVLLLEEGREIQAAAFFGQSSRYFGGIAFELKSLIFNARMDEEACRKAIREITAFACDSLKGKLYKLRYEYLNPRQDFIAQTLKDAGFRESAQFPGELKNGRDLILLDKMISESV